MVERGELTSSKGARSTGRQTSVNRSQDAHIWIGGPRASDPGCVEWLESSGHRPQICDNADDLERVAPAGDLVLLAMDLSIPSLWFDAIGRLRQRSSQVTVIVLAFESSEDLAVRSLEYHADDYIRRPFSTRGLAERIASCWHPAPSASAAHPWQSRLLGESESLRKLRQRLNRLSAMDCNVLITGESGTGKELAAEDIHRLSKRSKARMICLNCAALPDALIESELFGYERGAFTGADSRREGKFKAADGGVLFLDEVGDLSLFAQAKLLRAVEAKQVYRLGSSQPIEVDVRIVAATHRNLEEMVAQGRFRHDLFFRLNIGRIQLAPLRDRTEDVAPLLQHYLRSLNERLHTRAEAFSQDALSMLTSYSWPGNVRELKNLVESVLIYADSPLIAAEELPDHVRAVSRGEVLSQERNHLVEALLATNWNKSKAAEQLHWSRMTLYRKMARHAVSQRKMHHSA